MKTLREQMDELSVAEALRMLARHQDEMEATLAELRRRPVRVPTTVELPR